MNRNVLIILVAAVLIELFSAVQYFTAHGLVEEQLDYRAENEIRIKAIVIKGILNLQESTLREHLWDIDRNLANADSMMAATARIIARSHHAVGSRNDEGLRIIMRSAFRFITISMVITCIVVWIFPEAIARLFGAREAEMLAESRRALPIFALSFIPFCYIYVLMIAYKLYGQHTMALFISFALSLTVIPVLWFISRHYPEQLWYSYLIAYFIEAIAIFLLHRAKHVVFKL